MRSDGDLVGAWQNELGFGSSTLRVKELRQKLKAGEHDYAGGNFCFLGPD